MSRSTFRVVSSGFSHVGMRRDHNEDALLINPDLDLYIVADGMGGHNSGEIASRMATETIDNFFRATLNDDEITWPYNYDTRLSDTENRLKTAIRLANARIYDLSRRNALYQGMGTTVVALGLVGDTAILANVGDSRGYLLRDGSFLQITEDHSLMNDLLRKGELTPEEAEHFQHKNVIVRALGIRPDVEVDLFGPTPRPGDIWLLCSDGLTDMIREEDIGDILSTTPDLKLAAKLLIREANERGGIDNITVLLAQIV